MIPAGVLSGDAKKRKTMPEKAKFTSAEQQAFTLAMCAICVHIDFMAVVKSSSKPHLRTKQERLVARVHAFDKALIERGAKMAGLSVGSFLVFQARKASESLLQEQETIRLTAVESRNLVDALLSGPTNPTKAQKAAVLRYRKLVESDVNSDSPTALQSVALW